MPATIEVALLEKNRQRCWPPLPIDEVKKIARSVERYPAEVASAATSPRNSSRPDITARSMLS